MNSLRSRIIILSALVSLITATLCAISATVSVKNGIAQLDEQQATQQIKTFEKRLSDFLDQLSYEVNDYANWDELYTQMPQPTRAWAEINLTPGKVRGVLTQYMAIANNDRIVGRYRDGDIRQDQSSPTDPATADALLALLIPNASAQGISAHDGKSFFYAVAPIRPSDRVGPSRGHLIALVYLSKEILARLTSEHWQLQFSTTAQTSNHKAEFIATGQPDPPVITDTLIRITTRYMLHDGDLQFTFSHDRLSGLVIKQQIVQAINLTGLLVSLLAIAIGVALGWWWLRPIAQLADSCAQHSGDPAQSLPDLHGLREAELLHFSFNSLLARLHQDQERLAHALDQQTTANAIHRRFLAQLAHEVGQPIRTLIQVIEQAHANNGRIDPALAAHSHVIALRLEERLQDVLALINDEPSHKHALTRIDVNAYLRELCALLTHRAEQRHMTIDIDAPPTSIPLDPKFLSPILINLIANALAAGDHGTVRVSVVIDQQQNLSRWHVVDDGPGIPPDVAERFKEACQRGEVLPGTPGLGLGIALVLANLRMLGGHLSLHNTSSSGTSITFTLPLDLGAGNQRTHSSERFIRH